MSEMLVQEAYRVMQAECGIEVGDRVKILRTYNHNEMGCQLGALSTDEERVGHLAEVRKLGDGYIAIDLDNGRGTSFPFFCLELVEKAKPELPAGVIFEGDGLTVAPSKRNTFVSTDTIKRNLGL